MKKLILLCLLIVNVHFIRAQPYLDSNTCSAGYDKYIDSIYTFCDTVPNPNFIINIESTANNTWQIGNTTKFGTSDIRDTSCAIFTDSVNAYPTNNYSAFNFFLPKNIQSQSWQSINYYIKFWHKFDTDSLKDGCWLEASDDSGTTWQKLNNFIGFGWDVCNLYNNNLASFSVDTIEGGINAWSGNSNGWRYTALSLNVLIPIKPGRGNDVNALRFVFQSDSIQTNKSGWIIDDIATGWVNVVGINEITRKNQLPIYPNPSQNGFFNISFPSNYVKGAIEIYNQLGQKLLQTPLKSELDLSQFSNGMYYYRTEFEGKVYSSYLQKY